MRRIISVAATASLVACVSITDVTPMGNSRYMVGSKVSGSQMSHTEVKALAIKRAVEFCNEQKKEMVVDSSESTGVRGWSPLGGEVVFRCV